MISLYSLKCPDLLSMSLRFYHLPPIYVLGSDNLLGSLFRIPEDFSTWNTITLSNPTSVISLGNFNNNLNNLSRMLASQVLGPLPFDDLVTHTISSHPLSCSYLKVFISNNYASSIIFISIISFSSLQLLICPAAMVFQPHRIYCMSFLMIFIVTK